MARPPRPTVPASPPEGVDQPLPPDGDGPGVLGVDEPLPPDSGRPGVLAVGRRTTGRHLVLLAPDSAKTAAATLKNRAGLKLHPADPGGVAGISSLPAAEGLFFPSLGVACVNAGPEQAGRLGTAAANPSDREVETLEPERYVFATAGVEWIQGYRAAVDHLTSALLARPDAASFPATAAVIEAFRDDDRVTWGLRATGVTRARPTGAGILLAVLDTGVDPGHPDLAPQVHAQQSFIDGQAVDDGHGHGTHCAGIACGPQVPARLPRYGVATDARLCVAKVLSNAGIGTDSSILGGIEWAMGLGCAVISMSLGGPVAVGQPWSRVFEQVGHRALAQGSIIIAAAGNDSQRPGDRRPVSHPANCPSIVAVAALDHRLAVAAFSNAGLNPDGGQVDIAGPGVDILSAAPRPHLYRVMSGTSMAAPHVAGVIALHAEASGLRGRELLNYVGQRAQRLAVSSVDVGSGLIRAS